MRALSIAVALGLTLSGTAQGQELRAEMYLITPEAMNKPIGLVLITSTGTGVKLVADLQGLPPRRQTLQIGDKLHARTRAGDQDEADRLVHRLGGDQIHFGPQFLALGRAAEGQAKGDSDRQCAHVRVPIPVARR